MFLESIMTYLVNLVCSNHSPFCLWRKSTFRLIHATRGVKLGVHRHCTTIYYALTLISASMLYYVMIPYNGWCCVQPRVTSVQRIPVCGLALQRCSGNVVSGAWVVHSVALIYKQIKRKRRAENALPLGQVQYSSEVVSLYRKEEISGV